MKKVFIVIVLLFTVLFATACTTSPEDSEGDSMEFSEEEALSEEDDMSFTEEEAAEQGEDMEFSEEEAEQSNNPEIIELEDQFIPEDDSALPVEGNYRVEFFEGTMDCKGVLTVIVPKEDEFITVELGPDENTIYVTGFGSPTSIEFTTLPDLTFREGVLTYNAFLDAGQGITIEYQIEFHYTEGAYSSVNGFIGNHTTGCITKIEYLAFIVEDE